MFDYLCSSPWGRQRLRRGRADGTGLRGECRVVSGDPAIYTLWTTKPENARFCRRDFIHFPHNCVAQIVFTTFIQWCPAPSCPRRRRHGRPSARRRLRRAVPFAQTLLSRRDMARRVLASSFLSCSGAVDDLEAQRGISSKQLP
jgi:hypothetical protein